MSATFLAPMSADDFIAWALKQDRDYELAEGKILAMAPERVGHSKIKHWFTRALEDAVSRAGFDCEVIPDGPVAKVGSRHVFQPDVMLRYGPASPYDAMVVTDPVIVVEVRSPSTSRIDEGVKLSAYFQLESVIHYLIVDGAKRVITHHRRQPDGTILAATVRSGPLLLDPPGIVLDPLWPERQERL